MARGCSPSAAGSTSPIAATACSPPSPALADAAPPPGFVVAAGITTHRARRRAAAADGRPARPRAWSSSPASTSSCPRTNGRRSARTSPIPATGRRRRPIETHPQFHLKLLLDRMSVGRGEVDRWRWGGGRDAPAARSRAIANAMAPAAFTARWQDAQARRAAPDRGAGARARRSGGGGAGRSPSRCARRWRRRAGPPLWSRPTAASPAGSRRICGAGASRPTTAPACRCRSTPPGTLLLALADGRGRAVRAGAAAGLAQASAGDERGGQAGLAGRRPRARPRLARPASAGGPRRHRRMLADRGGRDRDRRERAAGWWRQAAPLLEPLERAFSAERAGLPDLIGRASRGGVAAVRGRGLGRAGRAGGGRPARRGRAGRRVTARAASMRRPSLPALLEQLMDGVAVRPPYGQHPRIFIWGLIEARLQQADLIILGGLNEGVWPQLPTPDPWLAPRLRHELGLARAGAADRPRRPRFRRRARRAARCWSPAPAATPRSPAIASRFWLRLEAMTGGLTRSPRHRGWARALDRPAALQLPPAGPRRSPAARFGRAGSRSPTSTGSRPIRSLSTRARCCSFRAARPDRRRSEPGLARKRGAQGARGLDEGGRLRPASAFGPRAEALLREASAHPLMRALVAAAADRGDRLDRGRDGAEPRSRPPPAARRGDGARCEIDGLTLHGEADRIDRLADGSLAIVDYKTGNSARARRRWRRAMRCSSACSA